MIQITNKPAEVIKGGENFYYCSECKNASNSPNGIPHAPNCSMPDMYVNPKNLVGVVEEQPGGGETCRTKPRKA